MGMSASQVRFLSLQSRKNSIGRQLLTLSNRKMALSRDMSTVALKYNNALNQTTLKWSNDSGSSYNTLSYDLMMRPNELNAEKPYIITQASTGKVVLNNDELTDSEGNIITDADGNPITYVSIAKKLSTYSGNDIHSNLQFNNINNLTVSNVDGVSTAVAGGSSEKQYYIPKDQYDYNFANTLRYQLFYEMGLISEADKNKQISLLNQLYGSEEAQRTTVYPVGSAWGDYYIAQANLEAYEDFLKVEHIYANSDTYSGTARTSESSTYATSDFDYHASLNGTSTGSVNTTITQKAYSNSANETLDHIDFNAFTSSTGYTDYKYTTTTDEDGSTIVRENNSFSSTHASDYASYADNETFSDYTYGISLSDAGINYTYKLDDVWQNAVKNTANASTYATNLASGGNDLVEVGDSSSSSLDSNDTNIRAKLTELVTGFASTLQNTTIMSINSEYLEQAKQKTVQYFIDNADNQYDDKSGWHSGAKKATKKAKERASGQNHIGVSRYGGVHSHSKAYVDTKTLLNTFMSFYAELNQNRTVSTAENYTVPHLNISEPEGTAAEISIEKIGNQYYSVETVHDATNYDTVRIERTLLSSRNPYGTGTEYDAMYDSEQDSIKFVLIRTYDTLTDEDGNYFTDADGNFITDDDGCYGRHLVSEIMYQWDSNTDYTALYGIDYTMYYLDDSAITSNTDCFIYNKVDGFDWDNDNDPTTDPTKLYGTLERNGLTYGFTTQEQVDQYLADGTLPGDPYGANREITDAQSSPIVITSTGSTSKYGISFTTYANDTAYHSYLENRVNQAYQHIKDLEGEIDNLYGSADKKIMDYYDALFERIAENGWIVDDNTSSSKSGSNTYLNNMLQNNDYFVTETEQKDDTSGFNYTTKAATSVRKIYSVYDDNAANVALAEYESEKAAISSKEEKIDLIMQKLETEQEAIETSLDSVQKIISENIDKTFKMFA